MLNNNNKEQRKPGIEVSNMIRTIYQNLQKNFLISGEILDSSILTFEEKKFTADHTIREARLEEIIARGTFEEGRVAGSNAPLAPVHT
jgi:hypothetical protein